MIFRKLHPLLNIAIELTNDCNQTCSFCLRREREIGYMKPELFYGLLKQIPRYTRIALSFGGESGLHPSFNEMASAVLKHTLRKVRVYSNGTMEYPEELKVIVNPKPPRFIINKDWTIQGNPPIRSSYCRQLYNYTAVLWNGKVTPCCADIQGSRIIGSVKQHSLKEIWNSKEYETLRALGHCSGCEVYKYL